MDTPISNRLAPNILALNKPSVLMIAPFCFFPPKSGGEIGVHQTFYSLSQHYRLHLLIPEPIEEAHRQGLEELKKYSVLHPVPLKSCKRSFFKKALSKYPIGEIEEFYSSPMVKDLIGGDFEFIQLEHSWWYHPALKSRRGKLVMTEHNYEFEYWREVGGSMLRRGKMLEGLIYMAGSYKVKAQEVEALEEADMVLALSPLMTETLKEQTRNPHIYTTQRGLLMHDYASWEKSTEIPTDKVHLIYVGALNSHQTAEAAFLLIEELGPLLDQMNISYKILLVGKDPIAELVELANRHPHVSLNASVADVKPYIAQADIYVVPLKSGSGIRIKVMEAMAMGKPIISTPKGVEGLGVEKCEGVMIANTMPEFARQISVLAADFQLRVALGGKNRAYAKAHFDWEKNFEEQIFPLYQRLIGA